MASTNLRTRLYDTNDQSIFRLGGLEVDKVAVVIPFNCVGQSKEDFRQTFDSDICHIWDIVTSEVKANNMRTSIRRFIDTTTAGQHKSFGNGEEQIFSDGLAYLRSLPVTLESHGTEDDDMDLLHLQAGGSPEKYVNLASNYCFFRSFIVSSTGKMGLRPSDTRVGDNICVLFGGGVPYVVRSQGTMVELVGELYLEGIMKGETIELYNRNVLRERVFSFI